MQNPILGHTNGYKICIGKKHAGQRWIPIHNFYVRIKYPNGDPKTLQARCATCMRIETREQRGALPRYVRHPWLGKTHTPEYQEYKKQREREGHKRRMKKKEYREEYKLRKRMTEQAKKELDEKDKRNIEMLETWAA